MTHIQGSTTTVQVQMSGRTILDALMHKLPSIRKYYRVTLIVPDNGIPIIEYHQAKNTKKPKKSIQFTDLLFADKKHDSSEKFAFAIYTIDKTITFIAQDETSMNEWLNKIRECHSNLYPEFKRYDAIFEANLIDRGLAKKMNIRGVYRLALCKDSLDLIPMLIGPNAPHLQQQQQPPQHPTQTHTQSLQTHQQPHNMNQLQQEQPPSPIVNHNNNIGGSTKTTTHVDHPLLQPQHSIHHHQPPHHHQPHHHTYPHHHQLPKHLPHHRRFHKRHPLLSSKTIELVLRSIRRWGHTDSKFYIESGRHSQIGEGDIWMALSKKAVARQLHELLLARQPTSTAEDHFLYKPPRSRSGSSSENAYRVQQSRSSSLVCLAADNHMSSASAAAIAATSTTAASSAPSASFNVSQASCVVEDDNGYLPMA